MAIYESGEMYLETILVLSTAGEPVRSIDIVRKLGYSKPSVSIAMSQLKKEGYVASDENGNITLTAAGKSIAEKIYERHLLLTQCLIQMGVPEDIASEDACKIEHDISDTSFDAIKQYMSKQNPYE